LRAACKLKLGLCGDGEGGVEGEEVGVRTLLVLWVSQGKALDILYLTKDACPRCLDLDNDLERKA